MENKERDLEEEITANARAYKEEIFGRSLDMLDKSLQEEILSLIILRF